MVRGEILRYVRMKINLKEVYGCGATFVLDLFDDGKRADRIFFRRFNNLLSQVFDGNATDLVLYTYGLKIRPQRITLNMTDGRKRMAKVDGLCNQDREDQKCAVVMLEYDARNGEHSVPVPRYACYLCEKETWGVGRIRMEVYDHKSRSIKEVNVHDDCKLEYLEQISKIKLRVKKAG